MGVPGNSNPTLRQHEHPAPGFFGGAGKPPGGGEPPDDDFPSHEVRVAMANFNPSSPIALIGNFIIPEGGYKALGYADGYIREAKRLGASYYAIGEIAYERILREKGEDYATKLNLYFIDRVATARQRVLIYTPKGETKTIRDEIARLTSPPHNYTRKGMFLEPPDRSEV